MTTLANVLLANVAPHTPASVVDWWPAHRAGVAHLTSTIEQAIVGGARADRLGYAFAAGYQAALHALLPDLPADSTASLCATERDGAHPRAIKTTLIAVGGGYELEGQKRWATFSPVADWLLVFAQMGSVAAAHVPRKDLRLVRVPRRAPGVHVDPMGDAPFAPEIPHAEVRFERVVLDATSVLPGDGYQTYVKRFRTVEDLHVLGATVGYLAATGRRFNWPHERIEPLLALASSVRDLSSSDPDHAATHIAVAGVFALVRAEVSALASLWSQADAETRMRWERDMPLLSVADGARTARTAKAWSTMSALPEGSA